MFQLEVSPCDGSQCTQVEPVRALIAADTHRQAYVPSWEAGQRFERAHAGDQRWPPRCGVLSMSVPVPRLLLLPCELARGNHDAYAHAPVRSQRAAAATSIKGQGVHGGCRPLVCTQLHQYRRLSFIPAPCLRSSARCHVMGHHARGLLLCTDGVCHWYRS